jgi:glycosyltransferase involved in cell wall biosynthesis
VGVNGLLYRAGSVSDLARKVAALVDDSELRARLGSAPRTKVLSEYTIEGMVAGFREAVAYCVERRGRG